MVGNLLVNPGAEAAPVGGEIPGWYEVSGSNWQRFSNLTPPHSGSYHFFAGIASGTAQLAQNIDLSPWATEIDAGRAWILANNWQRSYDSPGSPEDETAFRIEVANAGGVDLAGVTTPFVANLTSWQYVHEDFEVPPGARIARMHLFSKRLNPNNSNSDGYHDDCTVDIAIGPLLTLVQPITLPADFPGAPGLNLLPSALPSPGTVTLSEAAPDTSYGHVVLDTVNLKLNGGGSPETEIALYSFQYDGVLLTDENGQLTTNLSIARVGLQPNQAPGLYEGSVQWRLYRTQVSATYQSNIVVIPVTMTVLPCVPTIIYVDDDAPSGGDGTSWATAFDNLKLAKTEVICNGNPVGIEVRVAQGTYTPDHDNNPQRTDTFNLSSYMTIRGGYAGVGAPDPDAWDPDTYVTVLTGDLHGDDFSRKRGVNNGNNSYNVVKAINVVDAVLEGLTITGGNANGNALDSDNEGGGLYSSNSTISVSDCHFVGNNSTELGGGVCMVVNSDLDFTNCIFTGNSSADGGGAHVRNSVASFTNCHFDANTASLAGGGIDMTGASVVELDECDFTNNQAVNFAGAVTVYAGSNLDANNCDFIGNNVVGVGGDGGAIAALVNSSFTLESCTFSGNSAVNEGGAIRTSSSGGTILGCQFVTNTAAPGGAAFLENSNTTITACQFTSNESATAGGAVRIAGASEVEFFTTDFVSNLAESNGNAGGAVSSADGNVVRFYTCRFLGNSGPNGFGGAIASDSTQSAMLFNTCLFSGNTAEFSGAGHLHGDAYFNNCTIAYNSATGGSIFLAGGIDNHADGVTLHVRNTVCWGNTSVATTTQGQQIQGTANLANSCIMGWDGTFGGPITNRIHGANPLFLDPDGADNIIGTLDDDYRLDRRSLCIDWGGDLYVSSNTPTDILGNPRIVNCVDLGAVEYDGVSNNMIAFGCDSHSPVACFQGIGDLPGGSFDSHAFTISANGERVGGDGNISPGASAGLVWTVGGPAVVQQELLSVFGISNDGSKAVGVIVLPVPLRAGFWNVCNGITTYQQSSLANDLSADGAIAVGYASGPVKWINTGPPQPLGVLPGSIYGQAYGVSHSGDHIVGYVSYEDGPDIATIWRNGGAAAALTPGGPGFYTSKALDVSADGMVAVGYSGESNNRRACIFDPTGLMTPTLLGDLPGFSGRSVANAVSSDGRVIVGSANEDPNNINSRAFLYVEWTGTLNLKTLLETRYGLAAQLTGWTLESATDVSADGRTIVGTGRNPSNQIEGFVVHLPWLPPCATDLDPAPQGDGVINVFDLFVLLSNWNTNGPGADIAPPLDIVDVFDLFEILSNWGSCPMN